VYCTQENAVDQLRVCTVLNTREDDARKTYWSCQKHQSLLLHGFLSTVCNCYVFGL